MANQPTPRTIQPPPDLPSMPDVSTQLSNYLRNFSLWCRHGFADKISGTTAQPGIMLQAFDATGAPIPNAVYHLTIRATAGPPPSAPSVVLTLIPSGGGKP
jgi:hypothetical protein